MNQSKFAVELSDVRFAYGKHIALQNISLQILSGEFLGIIGPSGGGKTTLIKTILGMLEPQSGTIQVLGTSPRKARIEIGYVPQFPAFKRSFPITVSQTVLTGRLGKTSHPIGYNAYDAEVVDQALSLVEIEHLRSRRIGELSGGELQRVMIARALACQPKIMLLDEPTAHIDERVEHDIFQILKKLNDDVTVITVSHDVGFISHYVERVACLNQILRCHHTADITGEVIADLYGHKVDLVQHNH